MDTSPPNYLKYLKKKSMENSEKTIHKHSVEGELKEFEIWVEGFVTTGQSGTATRLNIEYPILAHSFDEAVRTFRKYNEQASALIRETREKDYISLGAFQNRSSNWSYWGCNLYDNEEEARKSFG